MKEYIKLSAGYVIVAVFAFTCGLFIALNIASDQSCYFEGRFGKDISFKLGKNAITDYDLKTIKQEDAYELCAKIGSLSYDDALSTELRKLRDLSKGPFEEIDIDLYIKFSEADIAGNQIAQACKGDLLNKQLAVFEILEPKAISSNIYEMRDFSVLVKRDKASCNDDTGDGETIWINKKFAGKWLNTEKESLPARLKAKASIIRTIVNLEPEDLLVSFLREQARTIQY